MQQLPPFTPQLTWHIASAWRADSWRYAALLCCVDCSEQQFCLAEARERDAPAIGHSTAKQQSRWEARDSPLLSLCPAPEASRGLDPEVQGQHHT